MIRWIEYHGRPRGLGADIGQGQKNARRRVAVGWLKENRATSPAVQLRQRVVAMVVRDHRDHAIRRRQLCRPVQRVLEHGARADERTVLFRFGTAQPSMHQRSQPRAFTTCQDDRPDLIRCAVSPHIQVLPDCPIQEPLIESCLFPHRPPVR